jgi:hypothetical protein
MKLETIKLKIGEDDWEMEFFTNDIVQIKYKSLIYTFEFTDLDHLKRDCKALAESDEDEQGIGFVQEIVRLSLDYNSDADCLRIVSGRNCDIINIEFLVPGDLRDELSKRHLAKG